MKLNTLLPWICVLGVSAGLAAVYVKSSVKDEELAKLREQTQEFQQLRTELAETKDQIKTQTEELEGLRKDKEELLKLRNDIGKLRDERQQLNKQLVAAQSENQRAQAQAAEIRTSVQQIQTENQQLRSTVNQNQQANQINACINNLRQIDGAKQQWALEHQKGADATPTPQDIAPYLTNNTLPTCPAGGNYVLNRIDQMPTCSIPGHALPK